MSEKHLPDALSKVSEIQSRFSTVMDYFVKLEDILVRLSKVAMFLMMTVIFINVAGRYVFQSPLTDTIDYVELYLMPMTFFLYISTLDRTDGNIGVDILRKKMTERAKYLVDIPVSVLATFIFYRVFMKSLEQGISALEKGQTTGVNDTLPTGITWIIIAVGTLLLLLRLVISVFSRLYGLTLQSSVFRGGHGRD